MLAHVFSISGQADIRLIVFNVSVIIDVVNQVCDNLYESKKSINMC